MVPRRGAAFALLAGMFFGLDMAFWSTGITISGATNPTLMANTAPAWVGLGALIFMGERLNRRFWGGLVLALVGAAIILGVDGLRDFRFGVGSFYGLVAGVFYGAFFLLAQRGRVHIDSVRFFWFSVLGSALVLFLIALLRGFSFVDYPASTFAILLVYGLVVQGLGWFAINYAQGFLPATIVSPTMLGQPVLTAILAALLLGEMFTPLQLLGGAAIMAGIYTVHWSRVRNT
jgi:drug/metabolite transporter (DMT)-like permease